ncbi:MAG: hypothetical protein WCI18_13645 [Pseudomonadota bacterium]
MRFDHIFGDEIVFICLALEFTDTCGSEKEWTTLGTTLGTLGTLGTRFEIEDLSKVEADL